MHAQVKLEYPKWRSLSSNSSEGLRLAGHTKLTFRSYSEASHSDAHATPTRWLRNFVLHQRQKHFAPIQLTSGSHLLGPAPSAFASSSLDTFTSYLQDKCQLRRSSEVVVEGPEHLVPHPRCYQQMRIRHLGLTSSLTYGEAQAQSG